MGRLQSIDKLKNMDTSSTMGKAKEIKTNKVYETINEEPVIESSNPYVSSKDGFIRKASVEYP